MMGQRTSKDFTNIFKTELLTFLRFELFQNTVFVVGSQLYRQIRGVAMGGKASAHIASLYCMCTSGRFARHVQSLCRTMPNLHSSA